MLKSKKERDGWQMKYKREEYFRFTFGEPLQAQFKIKKINNEIVKSSKGKAEIIDLSPAGLKFSSELRIDEAKRNNIEVIINFKLNDLDLSIKGVIVWVKEKYDMFEYGIEFLPDQEIAGNLIEELKEFAKKEKK